MHPRLAKQESVRRDAADDVRRLPRTSHEVCRRWGRHQPGQRPGQRQGLRAETTIQNWPRWYGMSGCAAAWRPLAECGPLAGVPLETS